jgi:pyruvyltransferase
MALYYWRKSSRVANFGDYAGPYLYAKITGRRARTRLEGEHHWVTVGSLMSYQHLTPHSRVWGSGMLRAGARFPRPLSIAAVRGPFTRQRCLAQGYTCPAVYGDPALLLPRLYQPAVHKRYHVGIILHHREVPPTIIPPGICYITLTHADGDDQAFERVIDQIAKCRLIASSSLHGIIVAHAYGIPALWCQFAKPVGPDTVKFLDYYHGIGVTEVTAPIIVGTATWDWRQWRHAIKGYPQPSFPIDTTAIWQSCPYR